MMPAAIAMASIAATHFMKASPGREWVSWLGAIGTPVPLPQGRPTEGWAMTEQGNQAEMQDDDQLVKEDATTDLRGTLARRQRQSEEAEEAEAEDASE